MEKQFSYRITKIAGRAVAVAMCALTGMVLMGGSQAAEVYLGTSYFPNPALISESAGFLSTTSVNINGTPNDGSTASSATFYDGIDAWNVSTNGRDLSNDRWFIQAQNTVNPGYASSVSRAGDLFYGSVVTYWRNDTASQNNSTWVVANANDASYSFDAVRSSEFVSNSFGAISDAGSNNYYFSVGSDVSSTSRGAKAYTYIGDFTRDFDTHITGTAAFFFVGGSAAAQNVNGRAIDINGIATFDGDNRVDGSIVSSGVYVRGSNVNFNGSITAPVYFSSAGSATINGGADLNGSLNFQGFDANLTLSHDSEITGIVTTGGLNGALKFEGSSRVGGNIGLANAGLKQMDLDGNATRTVTLEGMSYVNLVNINAAGNLIIGNGQAGDGLNTTGVVGGRVDFNNTAGTVTLTNLGTITGQIVSTGGSNSAGNIAVANAVNFNQNGTMIGNIGTSASNRIGTVSVGSAAAGTVDMTGDLNAVSLNIRGGSTLNITGNVTAATTLSTTNANSYLSVTSGNVTGNVTTANADQGVLTMTGGTQSVTGNVGAVAAQLAEVNAGYNNANTTINGNVFANNLYVRGTGTVNLNGDFTGASLSYLAVGAGNADGTVNLADGKTITGNVSNDTGTAGNGVFTFVVNGTMAAGYDLGVSDVKRLKLVNVGAVAETAAGVVTTDTIWATTTAINNGSTLNVRSGENINGAVTTEANNTATLTMVAGAQAVSGNVGASGASLATVNAAANGAVTALNGMVHATTLNFSGNGIAKLNGINGTVGGLIGTADFNNGTGELQIGDNVNLTTGITGIQFVDANAAAMRFNGSSTVRGQLGAAASGENLHNSTLKSIYAGVATETVTFDSDVYVSNSTFHVSGTGTVNLQGDLYGPLVYDANGVVNVTNGKSILNDGTAAIGLVTTGTNDTGTLNYLGNTTLSNDLGTSLKALKVVNFHSDASVAAVSQTVNKNVYATQTTIGNGTTATTANITANVFLGESLTLAASNVTLNTANQDVAQVAAGARIAGANANTLTFANTALADGRLSSTATVTKSTTGTGAITTNGATLNFSVAALPWASNAGGALNTAAASSVTGVAGSTLVMNGNEKVNVALLGSLRNNQSHTLIGVGTGPGAQTGTATDNSYVIDSDLSRATGDLVVTFNRNSDTYITKSATVGHFSNSAANRLGALGSAGTAYNADMQVVLNKLDIDQWGFGNNQANLETQVKRLAPIANASGAQAALASTTSVLNSVGERLSVLRGDVAMAGLNGNGRQLGSDNSGWVKVLGSSAKSEAIGAYDGYKVTNSGLVAGSDAKVGNGVVGGLFSYVGSNITQQDFRLGETGKMNSGTLAVYGTQEYGDVFVDGALAFSQHSLESNRATAIARMAKADMDMNQTTLKLSAGYRIGIEDSKVNVLTPMVSVEAASLKQKAYTETGADALSLNVDSKNVSRTPASLGLRFNTTIEAESTTFYPELMVAMNRNSGMRNTDVVASYVGDNTATAFTTMGVVLPKTSYTVGAAVRFSTSKTSEVQIGYRYEGGHGLSSNTAQLRGAWSF